MERLKNFLHILQMHPDTKPRPARSDREMVLSHTSFFIGHRELFLDNRRHAQIRLFQKEFFKGYKFHAGQHKKELLAGISYLREKYIEGQFSDAEKQGMLDWIIALATQFGQFSDARSIVIDQLNITLTPPSNESEKTWIRTDTTHAHGSEESKQSVTHV